MSMMYMKKLTTDQLYEAADNSPTIWSNWQLTNYTKQLTIHQLYEEADNSLTVWSSWQLTHLVRNEYWDMVSMYRNNSSANMRNDGYTYPYILYVTVCLHMLLVTAS